MVNVPEFILSTVVSTRIRFARNFAGFPFPSKMKLAHTAEVLHLFAEGLKEIDPNEYIRYDIARLSDSEKALLQEQHLVSPALLRKGENRAVFLSSDRAVSIMVNEEDHVREQYVCPGFNLYKAYERLSALDDGLASVLDFAYDRTLGYLTACPSNLGTGMRASVMMFLPGLTWKGEIKRLIPLLQSKGMTLRGAFGEGSEAEGYLYQVSNERTLGWSEKEILEEVTEVTMNLCDQELRAREEMLNTSETELRDRCLRAYGVLTNCALLDMTEFLSKIVDVRLGLVLGFFKAKDRQKFDEFLEDMQPAAFCLNNNLEGENERFYDEVRAETVSSVLPKLVQVVRRGR
jgi:protein arginine kinase